MAALFVGVAAPTWAGGAGVLISQPKKFPIIITQPGSYQLSENLTVPDADTTAIAIASNNVTIDLDGFSIIGPVVCAGASCSASSFYARGIDSFGSYSNITVRNGTIQGMGGPGIVLEGSSLVVENMHLRSNGSGGMLVAGTNAAVRHNNVDLHCGHNGIQIQADGFLVSDNVITGCGPTSGYGVAITLGGAAGSVVRNVVSNYTLGLALSTNTSYTGNVLKNAWGNIFPGYGINTGQNLCDTAACPNAVY